MKKIILLFLFALPLGVVAQTQIKTTPEKSMHYVAELTKQSSLFKGYKLFDPLYITDHDDDLIIAPFASATITITVTDSGSATLADIRDTLCTAWGYSGSPSDNAAKLAFLKQILVNKIVSDYLYNKGLQSQQSTQQSLGSQISVN